MHGDNTGILPASLNKQNIDDCSSYWSEDYKNQVSEPKRDFALRWCSKQQVIIAYKNLPEQRNVPRRNPMWEGFI